MLIYHGFPFLKEKTYDDKITWVCRQKAALQCKVRVTQDTKSNQFLPNTSQFVHDHPPISIRRRAGNLKAEREQYGLDPNYRRRKGEKRRDEG
jgi:hypothetical protein